MRRFLHGALAIALIAGSSLAAAMTRVPRLGPPAEAGSAGAHATSPLSNGLMVAVDPETGLFGPAAGAPTTIEEAREAAHRIAAELVTVTHADGSQSLIHDDRLADYAVIRIAPDGHRMLGCGQGDAAAHGAVDAIPATSAGLEVE